MYEGLVKRLHQRIALTTAGSPLQDDLREAADAIEELIPFKECVEKGMGLLDKDDELLKAIKPRWIPATEEPPLKVGDDGYNGYLVYANGYYEVADYVIDKIDNVPYFHVDGEWEPDVTHYMPLPEPPKESI
jgi:hypothetical protein